MNSKNLFIALSLLLASFNVEAVVVVEDAQTITTTSGFSEISLDIQRGLMRYFNNMLSEKLSEWHLPSHWNEEAEGKLLGCQNDFNTYQTAASSNGDQLASNNNVNLSALEPTGFIVGFGIRSTNSLLVGMGQEALLTFVVIPQEVSVYDKTTGQTTTTYETSWAIGGMGQGDVGVGAGAGLVARGAIGFIWGELTNPSDLQGTAAGLSAHVDAIQGLGFKAALLSNAATNQYNLIAMVAYDMGIALSAGVEGSVYYFFNSDDLEKFVAQKFLQQPTGTQSINAAALQ